MRNGGPPAALVLMLVAMPACTPWSRADVGYEIAFAGSLGVDTLQTRAIVDAGAESNPIVGPHGDRVPLVVYVPSALALHLVIAALLPRGWRRRWQVLGIALEGASVVANVYFGWGWGFGPWVRR